MRAAAEPHGRRLIDASLAAIQRDEPTPVFAPVASHHLEVAAERDLHVAVVVVVIQPAGQRAAWVARQAHAATVSITRTVTSTPAGWSSAYDL